MTIKEKLKICRFAEKVYQEQNVSRKDDGTYKKKKGLNIQAVCQQKFGSKLGGIRVPRLLKTARKMKWAELTESQQARMHHLTDNLKQSMGLKEYVKGWKCLSQADSWNAMPSYKQWMSRSRKLSGFRDWAESWEVGCVSFTTDMDQK